jgi:hypothetical protein
MARIRTIKPELWTDEKLTECSLGARLLFIGMLNFADDNGNLQRSSKKIKMQVFPADNIDCEPLLAELFAHGVLREYSVNNENFIHISGFRKHQVINRPSATNIPHIQLTDDSVSPHGVVTEGREGKGVEGKGKEEKLTPPANAADPCPHDEIIALYHEHLPMLTQVRIWNDKRKSMLRARWREDSSRQTLDWWAEYFRYVAKSDFLCGRTAKPFTCSLEWLVCPTNFAKVVEGNYENRGVAA